MKSNYLALLVVILPLIGCRREDLKEQPLNAKIEPDQKASEDNPSLNGKNLVEAVDQPTGVSASPRDTKLALDILGPIGRALESYKTLTGAYPTREQGLDALVNKTKIPPVPKRWITLLSEVPQDPWGRELKYEILDGEMLLWTKGLDSLSELDDIYYDPLEQTE